MTTIYKYLNLPKIDDTFDLSSGKLLFINTMFMGLMKSNIFDKNINYNEIALYTRHTLSEETQNKLSKILPVELQGFIRDVGLQQISNSKNSPEGTYMRPHIDGNKRGKHCLQYLLDAGGTDVTTTWYKENNYSIVRPLSTSVFTEVRDITIAKLDSLTKVEEVIFDPNRWAIFRTDIIHGVEPILTNRCAITIGFTNQKLFDTLISKYGIDN
jgi:hypothetical protein